MARHKPTWCATCGGLLRRRAPADDYVCVCNRPLFIPLKGEFYDAFAEGSKTTEFRPLGPRWNKRTCRVGREVVLSRGYGKAHRMRGIVEGFYVSDIIPQTEVWRSIYGKRHTQAACVVISLTHQPGEFRQASDCMVDFGGVTGMWRLAHNDAPYIITVEEANLNVEQARALRDWLNLVLPDEPSVTLLPADIDPFLQSITRSPTETLARVEPDWKHRAEEAERILADNMALANRTTRRAMDERNAIIQELRKRYSAAEIADMVGLTRQRVHQILNEAPVESSPNRKESHE